MIAGPCRIGILVYIQTVQRTIKTDDHWASQITVYHPNQLSSDTLVSNCRQLRRIRAHMGSWRIQAREILILTMQPINSIYTVPRSNTKQKRTLFIWSYLITLYYTKHSVNIRTHWTHLNTAVTIILPNVLILWGTTVSRGWIFFKIEKCSIFFLSIILFCAKYFKIIVIYLKSQIRVRVYKYSVNIMQFCTSRQSDLTIISKMNKFCTKPWDLSAPLFFEEINFSYSQVLCVIYLKSPHCVISFEIL